MGEQLRGGWGLWSDVECGLPGGFARQDDGEAGDMALGWLTGQVEALARGVAVMG